MNDIGLIFDRLFNFFNVSTIRDLAEKLNMSESTVSKWRQRDSLNAIKKKCRELGIYNEIFKDLNTSLNNTIKKEVSNKHDLSKYFIALQSVVNATSKEDELIEDIKILMKKYIGE